MGEVLLDTVESLLGAAVKDWAAILYVLLAVNIAPQVRAAEPAPIPLWANGAPGEPATKPEDEPALFLHQPVADKANGTTLVICPGGGYGHLAIDYEGHETAEWLNTFGVTAFV